MKRKYDALDQEAEREGLALKGSFRSKQPMGKRIIAQRRMHDSGARILQTRVERKHTWQR